MNLWILENNSGRTLLFKSFLDFKKDEVLVSGLISALNQFTVSELEDPIESIDMGGLRWIYIQDLENNLLFVAADTKDMTAEIIRSRLEALRQAFLEEYLIKNSIYDETWDGSLDEFKPFDEVIARYYHQWTQAEKVDIYAEFFDVLGVIQQVLNIIRKMLYYHILGEIQEVIYKRIEDVFEDFSQQEHVLENPELKKISFSRENGFNIVNLNPMNCDVHLLKSQLLKLLESVITVIQKALGQDLSLHYFGNENLFKYILNNIVLLKRLNLDVFLFNLLLIDNNDKVGK